MTAVCNDLADYEWLTGDAAQPVLDELAADSAPLHTALARLRRVLSPDRARLAVEQVELRRRAADKFAHAARMFFSRTALEQATDECVAAYKAARMVGHGADATSRLGEARPQGQPRLWLDLCCGIGGDLLALSAADGHGRVEGVDLNPVAALLAAANARAVLGRELDIRSQDAADYDFDGVAAWHIDPDRRPGGRRTTSLEWCVPNREALERMLSRVPDAAVKLAPSTSVPAEWSRRCELEWISRDRQCRQQVAWQGRLAEHAGQHRATIVRTSLAGDGTHSTSMACRTIVGRPNETIPIVSAPARFVFDVDPAVLAARLIGTLAGEHRLTALSAGATYLTGDAAIAGDAALACFEVASVLPFRARTIAKHLRAQAIGRLEIKSRGVEMNIEQLRRELKLAGDNSATLLVTNIDQRPAAIVATRV